MTKQKSFKERIRARMDKTGESYAAARRHLIEKAEAEALKRRTPKTISPIRKSEESVRENTGRSWDQWFKLLDKWGAKSKKHGEIARWLVEEQGVAGWWAQSITGAYEQARGIRAPGQSLDGTYTVNASKTVGVPVKKLFEAFHDESLCEQWLGGYELTVRTVRQSKSLTAAWEDETTRLTVSFEAKDKNKSQVALAHQRIGDARSADDLKLFWKERLDLLKKLLENK